MGMWISWIIGISSKGQATSSIEKYPVSFGEKKKTSTWILYPIILLFMYE